MLKLRKGNERGQANAGWLNSQHTFSFGHYQDPAHMGFRALRVINEDRVIPGAGFAEHGHANMEIISYVLDGALEHKDSLGTGSIIRPGEVQRMSAGSGIRHSEYNASKEDPVHFLQIWIIPDQENIDPGYEQKDFSANRSGQMKLVASGNPDAEALKIHQDVHLYASVLREGEQLDHELDATRYGWLQVARGMLKINDLEVKAGDGVAIAELDKLHIEALTDTEFLLFDLN